MSASAPRVPQAHLIETALGQHLFVADGSRLFDADASLFAGFESAMSAGRAEEIAELLQQVGLAGPPLIDDTPLPPPPIHALSLAVAQKCNLGCTYCYAQQGEFGGAAKNMPLEVAEQAVDLLVNGAEPGSKLNLAFLGGEPLVNRRVLQAATLRAAELAARRGIPITFSITTNGTLLTEEDATFFETHGFAVTVSLDGPREAHNALRPYKSGGGSFDAIMRKLEPLLSRQRKMQVSARVTVTPRNLELRRALDQFISVGFHSVGFSPMLSAPNGNGEMQSADLEIMLGEMIDCGQEFERRSLAGERYPFANMVNAMRGNSARHAPPISVWGRRGIPWGFRRRRSCGLPSLRRRRSGQDGLPHRRCRPATANSLARATACSSARALPLVLGALPVRWRLPSRSHSARAACLRLHPRLAALLPRGLSAPVA
jgi:uncharacterized protein